MRRPGSDRRPDSEGRSAGRTEAEVFLQSRLVLLHKLLFFLTGTILVVSVVLMGLLESWDQAWNGFGSSHRWMHVGLSAFFGCTWFAGSRWRLRGPVLAAADAVGLLLTALALATMVAHADTSQSGAMELVAGMLLILAARAIIIPSSGRQTFLLSLAASVVCIATFVCHGRYSPADLPHWRNLTLSGLGDHGIVAGPHDRRRRWRPGSSSACDGRSAWPNRSANTSCWKRSARAAWVWCTGPPTPYSVETRR